MTGFTRNLTVFTVHIPAHHVPPRYDIPEREYRVYADTRREALRKAVESVACEVGLPPWKPALREVARRAEIVASDVEVPV